MLNKEKYRELCKKESSIPIFSRDWWLDAVCGEDQWDVILIERGNQIIASMPYFRKKKLIFNLLTQPPLTQHMGIWIRYPDGQKYEKKLSFEKEVLTEIIDRLPSFDHFQQNFHYSLTNWLPFYWKRFKQTTRYTYVIEDISNFETVASGFSHSKRKDINKARKIVNVYEDLDASDFYSNHKMTLEKQNQKISYSFDLFEKIYNGSYKNHAGKVLYTIDNIGNIHSAIFVVWDEISAYYLISTIDPDFRNSGSASLLISEMIKYLSNKTKKFDFEGSMIEGVEASFKSFGSIQTPYFLVSKTNSKLLMLRNFIKEVIK